MFVLSIPPVFILFPEQTWSMSEIPEIWPSQTQMIHSWSSIAVRAVTWRCEMIGCRCNSAFIRLKEPAGLPPSHRPSVTAVTLLPSNQTLSASYLFCTRVNHNLHLFYYLVCLLTSCIDVPFLFCIYVAFEEAQCNVVVSKDISAPYQEL